jgi:hypothetical protein
VPRYTANHWLEERLADPVDRQLALSILGTADARAIADALRAFCRAHLGGELATVTFCSFSVGAGFGLVLTDERPAFLKAWAVTTSRAELLAVHTVEQALAQRGFPAPAVLVAPTEFMSGHASVLEWLDRRTRTDAGSPGVRRAMASTLAWLIDLAEPLSGLPDLPQQSYPDDATWGPTHNVLYDFTATAAGAEWIDVIAAANAALVRRSNGPFVIGHRDWSVQNVRVDAAVDGSNDGLLTVTAVYVWDCLVLAREPELVGMAAATFRTTWDSPATRRFATSDEMVAFVSDYEIARGRPFTANEWQVAGASATYTLAYTARCEHCIAPLDVENDSARHILRECAVAGRVSVFERRAV